VKALCQARQEEAPGQRTVIAADGSYGNHEFMGPLKGEPCIVVARLRRDRVLYREPGAYRGRGRPRKHGERFAFKEAATWGEPAESVEIEDPHWGQVRLRRWAVERPARPKGCDDGVRRGADREPPGAGAPAPTVVGGVPGRSGRDGGGNLALV
jgi:hypothetical protein